MIPICWKHDLNAQTPLPKICDANGRPLRLLGVVFLRFRHLREFIRYAHPGRTTHDRSIVYAPTGKGKQLYGRSGRDGSWLLQDPR